jgi:histidinol-phosphate phosphatase family protein
VKSIKEFKFIEGSLESIERFTTSRFKIIVITNQSAVGRGVITEQKLREIHSYMLSEVKKRGGQISAVYYCPHLPDQGCSCRKPKIGLFLRAKAEHDLNFEDCWVVGDKELDIKAGRNAGIKTVQVKTNQPNSLLSVAERLCLRGR